MQEKAEQAGDKLSIQLMIGKQLHPINIRRDKEEVYRKAARNINERLSRYQERYSTLGYERCMAITLLDFAVEALLAERAADTSPYEAVVKRLTDEVEEALGIKQAGLQEGVPRQEGE